MFLSSVRSQRHCRRLGNTYTTSSPIRVAETTQSRWRSRKAILLLRKPLDTSPPSTAPSQCHHHKQLDEDSCALATARSLMTRLSKRIFRPRHQRKMLPSSYTVKVSAYMFCANRFEIFLQLLLLLSYSAEKP